MPDDNEKKVWRLELDLSEEELDKVQAMLKKLRIDWQKSLYDLNKIEDMGGRGDEE